MAISFYWSHSDEKLKNSLRYERHAEAKWNRLFTHLTDSSREIRNMRARLDEFIKENKE